LQSWNVKSATARGAEAALPARTSPRALEPLPLAVRVRRFVTTAHMFAVVYAGYKLLQIRGTITGEGKDDAYWSAQHRRSALRLRRTAVRLEGMLIKACQFIGARADILPPEWVDVLSELQDRVPPRPFDVIGPWIEHELGRPLAELYRSIERTPIAAASLAQVHKAELHDGTRVAVKVQYPDIDRVIATDVANFAVLINLLAKIEPRFDLRIILRELRELIPLELDFVNEAANARKFTHNFAGDPSVRFPVPYDEFTCRTVLTMSFFDGVKISDIAGLERAGIDKHAVADLLTRCYLRQILEHGFFHGDPHPGNLLVQPGPVLIMLDLGLAKEFSTKSRLGIMHLLAAIVAGDAQAIGRAFRELGFETKSGGDDTFVKLGELFLGQALRRGRAYADVEMIERISDELMDALRANPLVRASSELVLVLRVVGLLSGIGKQLDSRVDPLSAMMPFLLKAN
jgi:predicted unusual protein kinase regulating ubiquinone biosynthesis (AarF/ABC1/UbiB family)